MEAGGVNFDSDLFEKARGEFASASEIFPALKQLSLRQQDLMQRQMMSNKFSLGDPTAAVLDLNHSIDFLSKGNASRELITPCIVPNSDLFHTGRCRLLEPCELLRLQGLWLSDGVVRQFEPAVLKDGAGNMFSAPVCLAAMLAITLTMAEIESGSPERRGLNVDM